MWRELARDPVVRLAAAVLVLVVLPFTIPLPSAEDLYSWATIYAELLLLSVTLAALLVGLRRLEGAERRFWSLWALAVAACGAKTVVHLVIWRFDRHSMELNLATAAAFFLFYVFAAWALESRPHLPGHRPAGALLVVDRVGILIFFTGMLVYFVIVPALRDPAGYVSSSLLMYVALDAYLALRLFGFVRRATVPLWRRVYRWLLVTALLWLATDALELVAWSSDSTFMPDGSHWELLWFPAWITLVLAARSRELPSSTDETAVLPAALGLGPLVAYAVSFPLIHFSLVRLGLGSAELLPLREVIALILLITLASMVVLHFELLRKENRKLEEQRGEAQQRIVHLAYHDALTGLPNRRLLADRLQQALARCRRFRRKLAVFLLDLDDFKRINDTLGHASGDDVLCQVAARLQASVRGGDTVARLGGDEFVVVTEGLRTAEEAERVVDNVVERLSEPFPVGAISLHVDSTIGWAVYPDEGDSPDALLALADADMYRRKAGSGDPVTGSD